MRDPFDDTDDLRVRPGQRRADDNFKLYVAAIERFGKLAVDVLTAIADGESLRDVVEIVGDACEACDHVDDELVALWERAAAAATAIVVEEEE